MKESYLQETPGVQIATVFPHSLKGHENWNKQYVAEYSGIDVFKNGVFYKTMNQEIIFVKKGLIVPRIEQVNYGYSGGIMGDNSTASTINTDEVTMCLFTSWGNMSQKRIPTILEPCYENKQVLPDSISSMIAKENGYIWVYIKY